MKNLESLFRELLNDEESNKLPALDDFSKVLRDASIEEFSVSDEKDHIHIYCKASDVNRKGLVIDSCLPVDGEKTFSYGRSDICEEMIDYTDNFVYRVYGMPIVIKEESQMGAHCDNECDASSWVNFYVFRTDEAADAYHEKLKKDLAIGELNERFNSFAGVHAKLSHYLTDEQNGKFFDEHFKSVMIDKILAIKENQRLRSAIGESAEIEDRLGF